MSTKKSNEIKINEEQNKIDNIKHEIQHRMKENDTNKNDNTHKNKIT